MGMNARLICFGDYQVHPTQGLSRDGQGLHVTPKSLALLWELVQHPREVVTKDELFNQVWTHSVVTDAALSSCIRELRQALQDDALQPQYIETVHRVGFRFLRECAPDTPGKTTPLEPAKYQSGAGDRKLTRLLEASDQAEAGGANGDIFDFYHGPWDGDDHPHHERLSLSQRNQIHRRVARYLELAVLHARWGTALMLGDLDSVRRFTRQGLEACSKHAYSGIAMTRDVRRRMLILPITMPRVCRVLSRLGRWSSG
jgi:DNA-binding winged helix-turn-helix (wHTH) protein